MARRKKKTLQPEMIIPGQPAQETGADNRPGSSLVKTCLLFGVILAGLHAFTWLFALKGYIQWGYGTAHIVSSILNTMGIQNTVDYNII
jgi:hypothetical protein